MIWTVTPSGEYLVQMRDELDALIGTSIGWDASVDGAWTSAAAELAFRADQQGAAVLAEMSIDTMSAEGVMARAAEAGLVPRPATHSRYIVRSGGAGTLPIDSEAQGGGTDGRARWLVVDATAVVSVGSLVTIEAADAGVVSLPSTVTLSMVSPVTGITTLTYAASDLDAFQVGREAEPTPVLRQRVRARQSGVTGSEPAITAAVLAIPWVIAVDVRTPTPGYVAVTLAPAPVGADQLAELDAVLDSQVRSGILTSGASSAGTMLYTAGGVENRAVIVVLVSDGTISDEAVISAGVAAVQAEFALLAPGQSIRRLALMGALDLPGIESVTTLTVGGSSAAVIAPNNAANVLVASPITVTVP